MDGAGRATGAAAQARWRSAEDRLYPLAMSDPDGYRQGLEAVRALVTELRRTAGTLDVLLATEAAPDALLAVLPAGGSLPADLLVQAACGIRDRELAAARVADRRAAAIASARAQGRAWVVLEGPERIEELLGGSAVATHLPSGRSIVAGLDPYDGTAPFRLQEFGPDGESTRDGEFTDRAAWLDERERWRVEIESS